MARARPPATASTEHAASERDDENLEHPEPADGPARGAKGEPHRLLAPPQRDARQHQPGDVRAGDDEQQRHRGPQRPERGPYRAEDILHERCRRPHARPTSAGPAASDRAALERIELHPRGGRVEARPQSADDVEDAERVEVPGARRRAGDDDRHARRPELGAARHVQAGGMTPTISSGLPSSVIVVPTMSGSPPNRRIQAW